MPDECVKEIVCTMEQFKNRLLARAGKVTIQRNILLIKLFLLFKNSKKSNLIKNDSKQITKNLLDNNNPVDYLPNVPTIVNKTNDQEIQLNQIKQQEQINFPKKKKIKVIFSSIIIL